MAVAALFGVIAWCLEITQGRGQATNKDAHPRATRRHPCAERRTTPLAAAVMAAFVVAGAVSGCGEDAQPELGRLLVEVWQAERGAPAATIRDVLQTSDGYLWVASEQGLARFDGVRFLVFDRSSTPALASNLTWTLDETRDGSLWVGTSAGLVRYADGAFTTYAEAQGLPNDRVLALLEDRHGVLWVGTHAGLGMLREGQLTDFPARTQLASEMVRALAEDRAGRLLIGTRRGLLALDGDELRTVWTDDDPAKSYVRALLVDGGAVWLGTSGGGVLRLADDGAVSVVTTAQGLAGDAILALALDHRGALWVGTNGGGLSRLTAGRVGGFGVEDGLPSGVVNAVSEDREHDLWVGTGGGGLVRLRRSRFKTMTRADGLASDVILPILEDSSGRVWVGTAGGGLNLVADGSVTTYAAAEGLPNNVVTALCEGADGALWVGTAAGGVVRLERGVFRTFTTADGLASNIVNAILRDRQGRMWVATSGGGLARFDGTRFTVLGRDQGLGDVSLMSLFEDRTGTIWVGTVNGGVSALRDDVFTRLDPAFAPLRNAVFCFFEAPGGALWIGTGGGGLVRFKDGTLVAVGKRDGLFDDLVYRILPDDAGNLWMSCNKGIFRVALAELDAVADGMATRVTSVAYGTADGMRGVECNGSVTPAGWRMGDGALWFPTTRGIVIVDPTNLADNRLPPPVLVESATADGREAPASGPVVVPAGTRNVEIRYTGLSLVAPEACRFAYRLEGFDPDWVDAGARRVAYYTNLRPGHYLFRVKGCNNDGLWNETGASLEVQVRAFFYQTPLFLFACALVTAAAVVGGHRLRVRGINRRQQAALALAEERRRTAEAIAEERRQAAAALTRFRAVFDHAAIGIAREGADGRLLEVNDRLVQVVGWPREELLGRSLMALTHPDDVVASERARAEMLAGAGSAPSRERRLRGPDGTLVWVSVTSSLVRDPSGAPASFISVVEDMTERKVLENALRQSQKMEAVGRLAGGIAHDLNNVLQALLSLTQVARLELDQPESAAEDLGELEVQIRRGASLTRQLLLFARRETVRLERLDLDEAVREAAKMLRRLVRENITLDLLPALEQLPVIADRGQLEQVLVNLVVNAADAMPDGGRLEVRTGAAEGAVWFSVADTGHGIPTAIRDRVFEPFFTTKAAGKGTGLGLAVVHGIVSSHGGEALLDSHEGEGTTFTVRLPRCAEEHPGAPSRADALPLAGRGERVLLVEDNDSARQSLAKIIAANGYEVTAVPSAEAAGQLPAQPVFDLMLTDVVLPGMSGGDLSVSLCARWPRLRVVLMSGYTQDEGIRVDVGSGAVRFLQKPFDVVTLTRELRAALEG